MGTWVCLPPEQPFPDHGRWAISISDKITAPKLNKFQVNIPLFGHHGEAKSEQRDWELMGWGEGWWETDDGQTAQHPPSVLGIIVRECAAAALALPACW